MYADQVEAQSNRSIKERLNRKIIIDSGCRRPISGKRQREDDDKWEHDLFDDGAPQISKTRVGVNDLRGKLQRKSFSRDIHEKISGILSSRSTESAVLPLRTMPAPDASKRSGKSVIAESPAQEIKQIASSVSKKKPQQTVESVDDFLKTLGLEKYSITFQAEEVDMKALVHMSDEDLKALGIPMGPRKKILLALQSRVQ